MQYSKKDTNSPYCIPDENIKTKTNHEEIIKQVYKDCLALKKSVNPQTNQSTTEGVSSSYTVKIILK